MSFSKNAFVDTVSTRADVASAADATVAATNRPRAPQPGAEMDAATKKMVEMGKAAYFEGQELLKQARMSPSFAAAEKFSEVRVLAVHNSGIGNGENHTYIDQANFLQNLLEIDPKVYAKVKAADVQFEAAVKRMGQFSGATTALVMEASGAPARERFLIVAAQHPEIEKKIKAGIEQHERTKPQAMKH